MTEEPRYKVLTCDTKWSFEFDLNDYAKKGWRIVVAGPTASGWYAIMEKPLAIEIKGTIWEKRDAGKDYGVHLLEWKDR